MFLCGLYMRGGWLYKCDEGGRSNKAGKNY